MTSPARSHRPAADHASNASPGLRLAHSADAPGIDQDELGRDADRTLVRRAIARDSAAFGRLWRAHAHVAHAVLLAMLPPEDADDVMQEVAVAAFQSLPALSRAESFRAWLCAIARNRGRNALKARRRTRTNVDLDRVPCAAPAAHPWDADEILEGIRCLPPCYREPLTLRLVSGLSGPEIAQSTGMTPGSVRVNLCRGMKLLRERLAR